MNKSRLLCLVFFLVTILSIAQTPKVSISESFNAKKFAKGSFKILGYTDNSFFIYFVKKKKIHIQQYQKSDFALLNERVVKIPGKGIHENDVLHTYQNPVNKDFIFFTTERRQTLLVYKYHTLKVDSNLEEPISKSVSFNGKSGFSTHGINRPAYSPNDSCYLSCRYDYRKKKNPQFSFTIYRTRNQSEIWSGEFKLDPKFKNYIIKDYFISDEGDLYVNIYYPGSKSEMPIFKIIVYEKGAKSYSNEKNIFKGMNLTNFDIVFDKSNRIICTAILSNGKGANGMASELIDASTLETLGSDKKQFSDEVMGAVLGPNNAKQGDGIEYLGLKKAVVLQDSNILIVSEISYLLIVDKTVRHIYKSIFASKLDTNGNMSEIYFIHKDMFYGAAGTDYLLTTPNNEVNFIFLDNPSNFSGTKRKELKHRLIPNKYYIDQRNILVSAKLSSKGQVKYIPFKSAEKGGLTPRLDKSACISDDKKEYLLITASNLLAVHKYVHFKFLIISYK